MDKCIFGVLLFLNASGLVLMFHGFLITLPVCRNIIALLLRIPFLRHWISFDKNIHFHKIVAWTMLAFTGVHTIAHVINVREVEVKGVTITKEGNTAMYLLWTHPAALTGIFMLFCMLMMYTTALAPIRRQSYELFWYVHHLSIPFLVALCVHAVGCFVKRGDSTCKPYNVWQLAIIGLGIYILERVLREYRSRQMTYITKVVRHPSNVVEIQFRKNNLAYLPYIISFFFCGY